MAGLHLSAPYRDDPTEPDLLCHRRRIIPAAWRLTLPGASQLTIRNFDPSASAGSFHAFRTCAGLINPPEPVDLEGSY